MAGRFPRPGTSSLAACWPSGLWYSLTILAILGAHEFGHYFACVYYRVNASLPFFLPVPPPFLDRHAGRVHPDSAAASGRKRLLFDIGIAGPLAGFVVAVPALFIGVALSHVVADAEELRGHVTLGEPLLFKAATLDGLGITSGTATRSTCTRWRSPPGSACWRRR